MSEIVEYIAELRRMASRFRALISYPGKHAFQHYMLLRDHGDELLDKVWSAGFLRSIQGAEKFAKLNETYVEEIGCYLDAFLFTNIVGFDPACLTVEGCNSFNTGLLDQDPVPIGLHSRKKVKHLQQLFTIENLQIYIEERARLREFITSDGVNHSSETFFSETLFDSSTWAEAMDLFGFELFERNARGCEMLIDIIEKEMASQKQVDADDGNRDDVLADGLSTDKRIFRWHGKTYTLGLVPSKVVELLHNRYLDGEYFVHEQFIKTECDVGSDMRHIVRDNHLEDLIVRQKKPNGKTTNGMWGLNPN